jgi:hypothetical protein
MNKTPLFTLCLGLFFIGIVSSEAPAQRRRPPNRQPPPTTPAQPSAPPLTCTPPEISSNERMTYLVGAAPMNSEERARIKEKWGTLTIPKGESDHAKEVHNACVVFKQNQVDVVTNSLTTWKKANPNATPTQLKLRMIQQEQALETIFDTTRTNERMALSQWDWRTLIDVGPVMNQGEGCNTCWAVAGAAAAACSMRKNNLDTGRAKFVPDPFTGEINEVLKMRGDLLGDAVPFVQDLLNCMPIKKEEICSSGWHGTAFEFMVNKKGAPMSRSDALAEGNEYKPGEKFSCSPRAGFIKAEMWDYVNSPPDKMPSVTQLKQALIAHGPIVAPIFYDKCLSNYRSGIFNEKNAGMVNHVVLLIGWDDKKQAWLIKNSWGEEWGEKGFGWVKYGSNNIGVFAAFVEARRQLGY